MKWEDNIKETLEERIIRPSDGSWNSLADRLDAMDKKKNKAPVWWMGVAASVIAILFTISVFFIDTTADIQKPVLVDTQKPVEDHLIPMQKSPQQEQLAETHQDDGNLASREENTSKKELTEKQNHITPPVKQNLIVAKNEKRDTNKSLEIISTKDSLENEKVSEIVAQIHDLKSQGQTVTDADIDALLYQAQKEIAHQTIVSEGIVNVDATVLLQDVETELRQSFRNKIFEALINSYETVRTAVAERNN